MSNHTEPEDKAERLLSEGLRGLPLRRAPSTLEARVFGELARRGALPWWQRSFASWPLAARAVFVSVCVALVVFSLLGGLAALGDHSLNEFGARLLALIHPALVVAASAGGLAALLIRVIPPLWLYGGMAVAAMLYVILFGLGATAYRALYLRAPMAGDNL